MLFAIIISAILVTVGAGVAVSRSRYCNKVHALDQQKKVVSADASGLYSEISRIEKLKESLAVTRNNIDKLDIPTPESVSNYDDTQSSLDKLSRYYENHNLAFAGTEQFILSLLPVSQVGRSLQAMAEVLPHDLGTAVFGNALASLKDGLHPDSLSDVLGKFVEGAGHLSSQATRSMFLSLEHHDYFKAAFTPIKAGLIHASGVDEAGHQVVHSLKDLGSEMANAAEYSASVEELASATDIDIAGHVPVVTLALSSFREVRLLAKDKTDYLTSLKNIALDATGAGVGALAGGKAGAIVGSAICPGIGTIVGGMVGAIGGAIGGRTLTNKVKMKPLNDAIANYENNYNRMKQETDQKSKATLAAIAEQAENKRKIFKQSELLSVPPVVESENVVPKIALVLYQTIVNEALMMQAYAAELRKSFWYSAEKHDEIITSYENVARKILDQMPPVEDIKYSPESALDILLDLEVPENCVKHSYQHKIDECQKELKELNDKNDSSILMWSYMINNLYQQTLNEIAQFSNEQMAALNKVFLSWKNTMEVLATAIDKEKGKLGLS